MTGSLLTFGERLNPGQMVIMLTQWMIGIIIIT